MKLEDVDLEGMLVGRIDEIIEIMDRMYTTTLDPVTLARTSRYKELKKRLEENEYLLAVVRGQTSPDYGYQ